jgi:hypothetical protein
MTNYLKKLALVGMLTIAGGAYTGGNFTNRDLNSEKERYESYETPRLEKLLKDYREDMFEEKAEEQSSDEIKLPYYKLASNSCSKYARLSAKKIFHKTYNPDHAWDLKYDNKTIYEFKENEIQNDSIISESIKNLILYDILKPGMMIVSKRDMKPDEYKKYKSGKIPGLDKKKNKIEDTHVILYLGINDNKEPEFFHQWENQREKITIEDFKDRKNLKPTLIIDTPDKTSL